MQSSVRQAFSRWGRPRGLRVDNGSPWGSWSDLPTDFALWLIGLGIDMIWNPPAQPQDNGTVERSQGTGKRWAEPKSCSTLEELQVRLAALDQIQREDYPIQDGCSRMALYPQLRHSERVYTASWEKRNWSLERVFEHMAGYAVTRRVDKTGQIKLLNRNLYIGVLHAGQTVYVMFDPQLREWIIADEERRELRRKPADYVSRANIVNLKLMHRPPSKQKKS